MTATKSAADLIRGAPKRYIARHVELSEDGIVARLNAGRTFYADGGEMLTTPAAVAAEMARVGYVDSVPPTLDAVREAMRRDKEVVSR